MADCCHDACGIDPTQGRQARMLWAVLIINAVMFVVEFTAGWLAGSTALLGDSLDMLGDALVYGFSLFAVARGERWKAVSAAFKGGIMAVFGVVVLAEAVGKLLWGTAPAYSIMATVGVAVLAANLVCLVLLTRHRGDDVNMRSAWVCSRNDIIANTGVLVAAAAVAASGSRWPDVVIGLAIAALFLRSAAGVLADARRSYQAASA
ncbi:MAG: cation diffusion facilitator family transporter [Arhodomonas sp.]|nr:cation diffusion facilitator family transporter [Arhodomonas sp.]